MNLLLDMLKSPDRSTAWGGGVGLAVASLMWLLQEIFMAAWHYTLTYPTAAVAYGPLAIGILVQHIVKDRYADGKPLWSEAERAEELAKRKAQQESPAA